MAGPGQVLVSQRIANTTGQHFEFKSVGLLQVRGIRDPLPAFELIGKSRVSPQRPQAGFANLLVGRDQELGHLDALLADGKAGHGRVLRLDGQPGVGKSRLVAEWIERARDADLGFQAVLGICDSTVRNVAYRPWQQVFHALLGLSEDAKPTQQLQQVEAAIASSHPDWSIRLPLLGDLMGLPFPDNATTRSLDSEARQDAVFAFALEVLQAVAAARPLLIVIEDAQWVDEPSQGLCLALGRIIGDLPIVLAIVHRSPSADARPVLPELDHLSAYETFTLPELGRHEVSEIARNRLEGKVEPLLIDIILAQTDGNPFFVEELLEALRETGRLSWGEDGGWNLSEEALRALYHAGCLLGGKSSWSLAPDASAVAGVLGLSDNIHDLVQSRLDRLDDAHQLTMKVASVIGRDFELNLLAAVHPAGADPRALEEQMEAITARDLVRLSQATPVRTYSFKHHITQEVMYEILPGNQQRTLHGAVGEALEGWQPEAVERLAYHFSRSTRVDRAVFYLDRAGYKAQRAYANQIALRYYDQALTFENRWEWHEHKAEVLHILGQPQEEREALETLQMAPGAPAYSVNYHWGRYYEATADFLQAQGCLETALAASREKEDRLGQVRCLSGLGGIATRQGDFSGAQIWYDRARDLLARDGARAADKATALVRVLNGLGIAHAQQEHFTEASACWEEALHISRDSGNAMEEAQALNNLGLLAAAQREFSKALTYHAQALAIRRAIGYRVGQGSSLYNLAVAYTDSGDYGQAQAALAQAIDIHHATGDLWNEAKAQNLSGVLLLLLGQWERAKDAFTTRGLAGRRDR